ncbi:MAG: hypothetical protein K2W99_00200 [Chthoniobacterales bacterium]|nr:hypothetical protein [Chthoniobacterales bacterium]
MISGKNIFGNAFFIAPLILGVFCSCSNNQQKRDASSFPPYNAQGRTLGGVAATTQPVDGETEDQLIKELFDPSSPAQQNINPYTTMPVIPHTVKEMKHAAGMKQ